MPKPLLIDVSCLCETHTDAALDFIYKAMGEDPPGGEIWEPHPNPFVRRIVELFTKRGLDRIDGIRAEMERWLKGGEHKAGLERPPRPAGAMARWSEAEMALSRLYLQSLPTAEFTLDDWLMLVDYLVQKYLPESDLRTEADWLATRSTLMGRVQAAMGDITEAHADAVLAALPSSVTAAERAFGLTPDQKAIIDFGRARCAENVTALADGGRRRMRKLIVDHQEAVLLGDRGKTAEDLQTKLLDTFGVMNRDWRRIAVTESTENANQGMVAGFGPGARLKRIERYKGACAFCRSIDGRVFTVVDPSKPDKDGDTEIWAGKTNVGRSASPRKRIGGALWEREPQERWWTPAGTVHPNCRGSWIRATESASRDEQFEAWLHKLEGRDA